MENKERDRMPHKNPDFLANLLAFVTAFWPQLQAVAAALFMAFTAPRNNGKSISDKVIESSICAGIALSLLPVVHIALSLFNVPESAAQSLSIFVGVFVGRFGSDEITSFLRGQMHRLFNHKTKSGDK